MKHFKNDPHVLKHWQKQLISMMIVVKHYKTDLLLWNTDKTTCTLENTTENGSLSSVWHYRVVLEISGAPEPAKVRVPSMKETERINYFFDFFPSLFPFNDICFSF